MNEDAKGDDFCFADGSLSLAAILRRIREQRNFSARALSLRANLSPSYVGKLESGEMEPSLRTFTALCRALGLSPREILFCALWAGQDERP